MSLGFVVIGIAGSLCESCISIYKNIKEKQ
jgi:hypothetical protein